MKILIIVVLALLGFQQQEPELLYKNGKPTTEGIEQYVLTRGDSIAIQLQEFLQDTIFDYFLDTDDLSDYYDVTKETMGLFYVPDNIILTNETKYVDYELRLISKSRQRNLLHANKFVKSVVIHELMHCYIYQTVNIMQYYKYNVAPEFRAFRVYSNPRSNWGSEFIEEGICEYVTQAMRESVYDDNTPVPEAGIIARDNVYEVKYQYSSTFLRPFLDSCVNADGNPKSGIMILMGNPAPTTEELLNPPKYFQRLNYDNSYYR